MWVSNESDHSNAEYNVRVTHSISAITTHFYSSMHFRLAIQLVLSGLSMFVGIYRSIAIFLIILIFYTLDFFFMYRYDRQRRAVGSGRSWDFTLMMLAAALLVILRPIFLPRLGFSTSDRWGLIIQIIGILLAMIALTLHAWARYHLRHFYAERVEVQPGHRLVDTGPYAMVRHPVITSFFMIATGLFLIDPAVTTLLGMIYVFWDFHRAARQEEELLSKTLPDYPAYMARTPRFLPRLWRRR